MPGCNIKVFANLQSTHCPRPAVFCLEKVGLHLLFDSSNHEILFSSAGYLEFLGLYFPGNNVKKTEKTNDLLM